MRIVGKRASEFSNHTLWRLIREKRVFYRGKWFILTPEMINECVKVLAFRENVGLNVINKGV